MLLARNLQTATAGTGVITDSSTWQAWVATALTKPRVQDDLELSPDRRGRRRRMPSYPTPSGSTGGLEALAAGTYQVYARMPELVYTDKWQDIRNLDPTPASLPVTVTIGK